MVESDAVDDLVRETIKLLGVECLCWRAEARVRVPRRARCPRNFIAGLAAG